MFLDTFSNTLGYKLNFCPKIQKGRWLKNIEFSQLLHDKLLEYLSLCNKLAGGVYVLTVVVVCARALSKLEFESERAI